MKIRCTKCFGRGWNHGKNSVTLIDRKVCAKCEGTGEVCKSTTKFYKWNKNKKPQNTKKFADMEKLNEIEAV